MESFKDMNRKFVFYVIFLLLASLMRVFPHPVGCSPLIAASLFIYLTDTEGRKFWLIGLPAFFVLTAQLQTGFWQGWWIQPVSLAFVLLASKSIQLKGIVSYAALGLFASCVFFAVSNTGAWIAHALPYPMTFAGWLDCMDMGIPYFKPQLMWDILFTFSIFTFYNALSFTPASQRALA